MHDYFVRRESEYNRGTGCGKTARPGLCGGPLVTEAPTVRDCNEKGDGMNINKILRVVVLGIVLITGAQTAGATGSCTSSVLVTAPLMTGEVPGSVIECTIVNVSDAPRDVTI